MTPQPDMIVAVRLDPAAREAIGGDSAIQVLARLKPGVTAGRRRAPTFERMLPIWLDAWPMVPGSSVTREAIKNWRITPVVRPLKDDLVGGVASTLWVLMGAIGAVLLVACANIANLMLVRADARRQELAVRAALGAGRGRIARELLVEGLVIGAAGGVLGLMVAYLGLQVLVALGPSNLPRLDEIGVYPPVLVFTVAVSLASTLVFGSITALKHARVRCTCLIGVRARLEREPRAERDAQRIGRRAGGARARAGRERGADGSNVRRCATSIRVSRTRRRFKRRAFGCRTRSVGTASEQYTRVQHEILDRSRRFRASRRPASRAACRWKGRLQIQCAGRRSKAEPLAPERSAAAQESSSSRPGISKPWARESSRDATSLGATSKRAAASRSFPRISLASSRRSPRTRSADAFGFARTISDAWREVIGVVQSVHEDGLYEAAPSIVYWPGFMENIFGSARVRNADRRVCRPQRARGHGEPRRTRSATRCGR